MRLKKIEGSSLKNFITDEMPIKAILMAVICFFSHQKTNEIHSFSINLLDNNRKTQKYFYNFVFKKITINSIIL